MTNSIANWRYQAKRKLKNVSETAEFEINAILCEVLNKDLTWCLANPNHDVGKNESRILEEKLENLISGMPLAYVLGSTEFFGLKFLVDKNVLIPRPETEMMVETAINWIADHPDSRRVVDIGTGTGAIILSVLNQFPELSGIGIDISRSALITTIKNKNYHKSHNLSIVQMDCLSGFKTQFDVILANLPYIPGHDVLRLKVAKYEPIVALNGGLIGTEIIFSLIEQIPSYLRKPGMAMLEMQYNQAATIVEKVKKHLPNGKTTVINDLSGLNRFVKIEV